MFLSNIINSPDTLPFVACRLEFINLHALRETCREFKTSITTDLLAKREPEAFAKYAHATLQPNGAFQLNSRFGLHTVYIQALPGLLPLMVESTHMTSMRYPGMADRVNPLSCNPVIAMQFNGETFIGRPWGGVSGRDFLETRKTKEMFKSTSTVLLVGNVWISKLIQTNFFGDNITYTVLQITLDRGNAVPESGEFRLQMIFTPVGASTIDVVQANADANEKRALRLPNGAFRFKGLRFHDTVDVRLIPFIDNIMIEAKQLGLIRHNPFISMVHNGNIYVGRSWGVSHGGRDYRHLSESMNMFHPDSTVILDLAGGVWISGMSINIDFFSTGPNSTVLELTLDKGVNIVSGGMYHMQLIFTRIEW